MSSQRYQEFIAERTRLLERIKELETENAELRKRLGEFVPPASPAPNAIQKLSLQEKIDLFCSLFKGRISQYAKMNGLRYVTNVNTNVLTAPIVSFHR